MKIITTTLLVLLSYVLKAQSIEGKWLMSTENAIDTYSIPEIFVIEFNKGMTRVFDFDKPVEKEKKIIITKDTLEFTEKDSIVSLPYKFISNDVLQIVHFIKDEEGEKSEFPVTYFRIKPTKTSLSKEEIENIIYKTEIGTISFEKSLENYLLKVKEEDFNFFNERFFIEKLDDTFVISSYQYGKRNNITLIKEVNNNGLVLVGGNEKPYLLTLKKVNTKN
ncbi:conserved protein of unknown function [Tenacibaculum sp. 190130A14a]|uniref:Gingipain propeptide domain-containing protein n=1 Tax=Tenacibaculum polynesiense TaxID=3137857 RepID=A0ABM9P8K5_9FLAO